MTWQHLEPPAQTHEAVRDTTCKTRCPLLPIKQAGVSAIHVAPFISTTVRVMHTKTHLVNYQVGLKGIPQQSKNQEPLQDKRDIFVT